MAGDGYSQRFRKAARAERDRLARHRAKAERKREELQKKLDQAQEELDSVVRQIEVQEQILADAQVPEPDERNDSSLPETVLTGRRIRTVAIRVLLKSGKADEPIHYRDWLKLIEDAGYTVRGKRPETVLHNQVGRSPAVKSTTQSGVFELDRAAPERLQGTVTRLSRELADASDYLTTKALDVDIQRNERWLQEAADALSGT